MSAVQPQVQPVQPNVKPENDWTIMVFFAGDPLLSPSMTAQLKALKDAGFQDNTTVLVHYDPNERGIKTTTFEINRERKAQIQVKGERGTRIGDGKDPFVRNLVEDSIEGVSKSANATQALRSFLINGLKYHRANHYVVFLVGHGVIVGNDFFLPDRSPESGITLKQLGEILKEFQHGAKLFDGEVELIGLHSCSMSGIEVAYELTGAAKYMLATEGPSFVSSWPYRQLLKKILNSIDLARKNDHPVDLNELVTSVQQLSLHNSTDFMFSGLSADVCLCSLDAEKMKQLNTPIRNLTKALKEGMKHRRGLELITFAHLQSQSYFQESYTDLYDFSLCLERQCDKADPVQQKMADACKALRAKLEESPDNVIVQSDFFGPLFQYSHGLSIFFPWSRPIDDFPLTTEDSMLGRYQKYDFTQALGDDSWLSFLKDYFAATLRKSRQVEDGLMKSSANGDKQFVSMAANGNGVSGSNGSGGEQLDDPPRKDSPALTKDSPALEKDSPALLNSGCGCSVKNYPMQFSIKSPRAELEYNPETQASISSQAQRQPAWAGTR